MKKVDSTTPEIKSNEAIGMLLLDGKLNLQFASLEAREFLGISENDLPTCLLPAPLIPIVSNAITEKSETSSPLKQIHWHGKTCRVSICVFRNQHHQPEQIIILLQHPPTSSNNQKRIRRWDQMATLGMLGSKAIHEIKNNLVPIKTFAQLIANGEYDKSLMKNFIPTVIASVNHIDKFAIRMLGLSKEIDESPQDASIHNIIQESAAILESQLKIDQHELKLNLDAALPIIHGYSGQLRQIILNLLMNAHEAINGPGTIEITTQNPSDSWIDIEISDTGCGIDPQFISRIFDPYFTTKANGTGLGLHVIRDNVEYHGGEIHVQSQRGEGTRITISLPLAPPEHALSHPPIP